MSTTLQAARWGCLPPVSSKHKTEPFAELWRGCRPAGQAKGWLYNAVAQECHPSSCLYFLIEFTLWWKGCCYFCKGERFKFKKWQYHWCLGNNMNESFKTWPRTTQIPLPVLNAILMVSSRPQIGIMLNLAWWWIQIKSVRISRASK